jgi:hypothetical protein
VRRIREWFADFMPQIICPQKVTGCDCVQDDPFQNLSSEAPDLDTFIANVNFQGTDFLRLNQSFEQLGCLALCESTVSQEEADDCALKQAQLCAMTTWRNQSGVSGRGRPGTPIPIFFNRAESCNVQCPDGTNFGWTIGAGTIVGRTQQEADALAEDLACQRAALHRICISPSTLPGVCQNGGYFQQVRAVGGIRPYIFSIGGGALPSGLSIDPASGVIAGTSNATPGIYAFLVKLTDAVGTVTTKAFTIRVAALTDTSPLPDATISNIYLFLLGTTGLTAPLTFFISSGTLPTGLTLDPDTGEITGTPTIAGTSSFTISVRDSS